MNGPDAPKPGTGEPAEKRRAQRPLTPEAERALAEAAARRAKSKPADATKETVKETGGRGGLEPTRYGDWEVNGIASDF